jgi:hypothetical protein
MPYLLRAGFDTSKLVDVAALRRQAIAFTSGASADSHARRRARRTRRELSPARGAHGLPRGGYDAPGARLR